MSFDFREYPDASHVCVMCGKFDCSKPGEQWLHLLAFQTDNEYQPAIGATCRRNMTLNDPDLPKPEQSDPRIEIRPPTDEEIGAYIRKLYEGGASGGNSGDGGNGGDGHSGDGGHGGKQPKPDSQAGTSGKGQGTRAARNARSSASARPSRTQGNRTRSRTSNRQNADATRK